MHSDNKSLCSSSMSGSVLLIAILQPRVIKGMNTLSIAWIDARRVSHVVIEPSILNVAHLYSHTLSQMNTQKDS